MGHSSAAWSQAMGPWPDMRMWGSVQQATRNPVYQHAGAVMLRDLNSNTRTEGGYASVANVVRDGQGRMPLEDHMPSYFLAEACKYLFLLYNDTFLQVAIATLLESSA